MMHAGEWCLFAVLFNLHIFTLYLLLLMLVPFDVQVLDLFVGDLLATAKL